LLADLEGEIVLPFVRPEADPVWHLYTSSARNSATHSSAYLNQHGIGAGIHYPTPLHLQPAYADLGYTRGALPITEEVADTCLSLPIYPEMTNAQQESCRGDAPRLLW
jgi:dTDP-4-amino-4,6-dideoxygalactose transaminase